MSASTQLQAHINSSTHFYAVPGSTRSRLCEELIHHTRCWSSSHLWHCIISVALWASYDTSVTPAWTWARTGMHTATYTNSRTRTVHRLWTDEPFSSQIMWYPAPITYTRWRAHLRFGYDGVLTLMSTQIKPAVGSVVTCARPMKLDQCSKAPQ